MYVVSVLGFGVLGWLCVLRWQVNIASGAYFVVVQVHGPLILNDPSYVFERWHGTLLIIAVTIVALSFNTFFAKRLPLIEGLMLVIHSCGFVAILTPLWVFARKKIPHFSPRVCLLPLSRPPIRLYFEPRK